jgi:hypothetical protein
VTLWKSLKMAFHALTLSISKTNFATKPPDLNTAS